MSKVKVIAWSAESTALLVATYTGDNTKLAEIATALSKTVPMIRSKLVSEKLYVANAKTVAGAAAAPKRKASLVLNAETKLGLPKGSLETFGKASKVELERLLEALSEMVSTEDELED